MTVSQTVTEYNKNQKRNVKPQKSRIKKLKDHCYTANASAASE